MDNIEITWQDAQQLAENLQVYSEDLLSMWQSMKETCADLRSNWKDPASKQMIRRLEAARDNLKAASADAENIAVTVAEITNILQEAQKTAGIE